MAIPSEPLNLSLDVDALTLDDLELFESFSVKGLRAFMSEHGNWTNAQIGKITVKELREIVAPQIGAALKDAALPKANAPR